jgi:hypothetical protein
MVKHAFHHKINPKFVKQTNKKSQCAAKTILYILQTVEKQRTIKLPK